MRLLPSLLLTARLSKSFLKSVTSVALRVFPPLAPPPDTAHQQTIRANSPIADKTQQHLCALPPPGDQILTDNLQFPPQRALAVRILSVLVINTVSMTKKVRQFV